MISSSSSEVHGLRPRRRDGSRPACPAPVRGAGRRTTAPGPAPRPPRSPRPSAVRGRCGPRPAAGPPRRGRSRAVRGRDGQRGADVRAAAAGQPRAVAVAARAATGQRRPSSTPRRPQFGVGGERDACRSGRTAARIQARTSTGSTAIAEARPQVRQQPGREIGLRAARAAVQRADPAGAAQRGGSGRWPGAGAVPVRGCLHHEDLVARPRPATARAGRRRSAGGPGSATARRRARAAPVPAPGRGRWRARACSVPPVCPGSCPTAERRVRERVGSNRASRSGPSAFSRASQRAFRDAASGPVGHPRPSRGGATDQGMRSASSGASSVRHAGHRTTCRTRQCGSRGVQGHGEREPVAPVVDHAPRPPPGRPSS